MTATRRDPGPAGMAQLLCVAGPHAGTAIVLLDPDDVLVGSGESSDFVIAAPDLAPAHLRLQVRGGRFRLTPLGGANPTRIGDREIEGTVDLRPGDSIRIGEVELVLLAEATDLPGWAAAHRTVFQTAVSQASCRICRSPIPPGGERLCPLCARLVASDATLREVLDEEDLPSGTSAQLLALAEDPAPTGLAGLPVERGPLPRSASPPSSGRPPPSVDPIERVGPFAIHQVLGRGSMGLVLRVWDLERSRWLVVKVMREELLLDEMLRARFLREIAILVRLDHPGILPVVDVGRIGELPYVAMPFVEGAVDLHQRILQTGPPDWPIAVAWAAQAGRALHHAHKRRIVHRDVKPGNLLLDPSGRIRLLDFGLAAALESSGTRLTGSGSILGTPYFLAPEQIGYARGVDHRADVYGLGATLFHLLTGELPFLPTNSFLEVCQRIVGSPPFRIREFAPDLPGPLDEAIARAMAKRPSKRFPHAKAFVEALESI